LKQKATLDGREKKKLGRVEAALQKKVVKFNKSMIRYPLSRKSDLETVENIEAMRSGDIEKTVPNWKLPKRSLPASSMLSPLKSSRAVKAIEPSSSSIGVPPVALDEKPKEIVDQPIETKKPEVPKSFFQRFFGRF
jgi:hypothetical protein